MTVQFNAIKASCYVTKQVERARQKGLTLELMDDFDLLLKVVEETSDRAPLTPIFDNRVCDVGSHNAFWVKGTAADGRVVHLQAVRRDDLEGESLSDFLARMGPHLMSPHIPGIPEESDYGACRYVREMTGRLCYHGEVWLSQTGEFRGQGLGVALPRLGVALALMRWAPDGIYGFVHPDLVLKGIPARYGYMHTHPFGIRWKRKDGLGTLDESITWMTGEDMSDLIEAA
ncbi:MAG: hypothetical protein RIM33_09695 [Alphaproteobacteria bacterium]